MEPATAKSTRYQIRIQERLDRPWSAWIDGTELSVDEQGTVLICPIADQAALQGLLRPTGGRGTIFGQDIARDSLEIRRRVGYLAQEPRYDEQLTARETLRFKMSFYDRPGAAAEKRMAETLELVGLSGKADRPIRGFSGGERQRLGIAQAEVTGPDLLILDEPAASLDPMGRHDVLEVMVRLRERTTVFYSTHILDDVQRVSDRVAILDRGTLVAQAPIEELLDGSGETAYTLTLNGETGPAYAPLSSALPIVLTALMSVAFTWAAARRFERQVF